MVWLQSIVDGEAQFTMSVPRVKIIGFLGACVLLLGVSSWAGEACCTTLPVSQPLK